MARGRWGLWGRGGGGPGVLARWGGGVGGVGAVRAVGAVEGAVGGGEGGGGAVGRRGFGQTWEEAFKHDKNTGKGGQVGALWSVGAVRAEGVWAAFFYASKTLARARLVGSVGGWGWFGGGENGARAAK